MREENLYISGIYVYFHLPSQININIYYLIY